MFDESCSVANKTLFEQAEKKIKCRQHARSNIITYDCIFLRVYWQKNSRNKKGESKYLTWNKVQTFQPTITLNKSTFGATRISQTFSSAIKECANYGQQH